ncbi:helix-turn-helix transcriptional regulator [Actinophytocola sp. KF-1]
MSHAVRTSDLAGLVSAEAEELYRRLLAAGSLRVNSDDGPGGPVGLAELLECGVIFRVGGEVRAVDPAAALRILLAARQHEVLDAQSRILDGWHQLSKMLPSAFGAPGGGDGVRVISRVDDVVAIMTELRSSVGSRMRSMETDDFPALRAAGTRSATIVRQVLCESHLVGGDSAVWPPASGEEVRLRARLPVRLLHVDDRVALVTTDRTATTALLVRSPPVVELLGDWFDLLWDHPATLRHPVGGAGPALSPAQRDVLTLMLDGGGDEAIARRLGVSVTTVRRHIKAIYGLLGVNNRFAAGIAAARRKWV